MPAALQNYQPVTAERLRNPESGNWLMNRRTYDGWGYSPLDQITPANVGRLRPVWVFSTQRPQTSRVGAPGQQRRHVRHLADQSGDCHRRQERQSPVAVQAIASSGSSSVIFNDTNRGVALYEDRVYYALTEAVLVALSATTGKEVWRTTIADNKAGYYTTLSPMIADGKILVGASGGESESAGFIAAFKPDTGKELWRTFTIPAPGEPGSETWPKRAISGSTAVHRCGCRETMTRRQTWLIGGPETPGLTWAISAPATIFTVVPPL